jgi:hypothetical protein
MVLTAPLVKPWLKIVPSVPLANPLPKIAASVDPNVTAL